MVIDIKKNIIDSMLEIVDDEKQNFSKENNYIKLMNMLLEQKKQLEMLRKHLKHQNDIINHLEFGI